MKRWFGHVGLWVGLFVAPTVALGCEGSAPPAPSIPEPDAGSPGGDDGDPDALAVSGTVIDYFSGSLLDTTLIQSDGLSPEASTATASDGSYSLPVAADSKLYILATRAGYLSTRNPITTIADMAMTQGLFLLSESDVQRQYASVGSASIGTDGYVEVELEAADGTPLAGIGSAAIQLLDETGSAAPFGGVYFAGSLGDLDPTVLTSTAFGSNGARAGLINVPKGNYSLTVTSTTGVSYTPIVVEAGAATLVIAGGSDAATTAPVPTTPSFATDIYPRLQQASLGGLGCANCHTPTGPAIANTLPYDGDPTSTYTLVTTTGGVIVTATPDTSLLLTMPLYETTPPQNHPNATFLDTTDPDYKLFLAWITAGAPP